MEMFKWNGEAIPKCAGVPEFSTEFALNAMKHANPQSFDDLVRLSSLLHGTDTWLGNADILITEGTASISEVLASRNDIYDVLIEYGIDENAHSPALSYHQHGRANTLGQAVRSIKNHDKWQLRGKPAIRNKAVMA